MKTPIKYHHTTDEERQRIAVLAAQGYTANAISKQLDRDRATIVSALKRQDVRGMVDEARIDLVDGFQNLCAMAIESINHEDLSKVNCYQRAIIASVAFDKFRLGSGQSTSNQAILLRAIFDADEGE